MNLGSRQYGSFWQSPTLDELARLQNVEPISDVEELFGTWPGDGSDRFEEEIDALRHRDSGHSNSGTLEIITES